jgi:flagellar hook assembly protein FlgD
VTFDAPTALQTSARFSQVGEYVLGFAANDSELQTSDNVTITVNSAGGGGDNGGGGGDGGNVGSAGPIAKKGAFHPENGDTIEIPDSSADIYNRQGAKVRSLSGSGAIVLWDGKNDDGKILPSGIYLYKGRNNKTGKVVLIK